MIWFVLIWLDLVSKGAFSFLHISILDFLKMNPNSTMDARAAEMMMEMPSKHSRSSRFDVGTTPELLTHAIVSNERLGKVAPTFPYIPH